MVSSVWPWVYRQDLNDPWSDEVDGGRCQYRLFEWHAYQCSRKPKEIIDGYGFCTQHARMLKARLGRIGSK